MEKNANLPKRVPNTNLPKRVPKTTNLMFCLFLSHIDFLIIKI